MGSTPSFQSFIPVSPESHFPIQNLPYGVFSINNLQPRIGVAIGEFILDLCKLESKGYFDTILTGSPVFDKNSLNEFINLGSEIWQKIRTKLQYLLQDTTSILRDDKSLREDVFYKQELCKMYLPIKIGEFTDFYSSYNHAFNVGNMIRGPENALMPNWKHLPVAYHGRASSVIVTETNIKRPKGQILPPGSEIPVFQPTGRLDYELEMGFIIGKSNDLGEPVDIDSAEDHIFGYVLLNDWSARDVQVWEYRPLGPFLAKNFATSISPWVVTSLALEPFKTQVSSQDPEPLDYLKSSNNFVYDIELYALIQSETMNTPMQLTHTNHKYLYWSPIQQLTHHTITGCNLQVGDLLGSGTISGPTQESRGCLLEINELGKKPITLNDGNVRLFLQDGDTIILSGFCQGADFRVGFGEVRTKILPAN
ncbi:MAG: fumarylacetoacetase [Candidatus Heimdallarchaeota archaeon]|nr:fumarylacetoacetase [Candidatus Heimdallarchaeota archaeon]MDH5644834.1 fumarylacetoacetase [Candidatus Heimdallarchaeota archaeon]